MSKRQHPPTTRAVEEKGRNNAKIALILYAGKSMKPLPANETILEKLGRPPKGKGTKRPDA